MIMQNAPAEVNWLVIIVPSLIVGVFTILVQLLVAFWLTRVTENVKREVTLELERNKAQLQSEFQTNLYEFQTRYSLLHQRRADAIEKMYEILIDLGTMVEHTRYKTGEQRKAAVQETIDKHHEYINFYLKNQLYFDDELGKSIEEVRDLFSHMTDRYIATGLFDEMNENDRLILPYKAEAGLEELEAHKNFRTEYPKLRIKLRDEFRSTLSAINHGRKT
jgi:hypothetical protein